MTRESKQRFGASQIDGEAKAALLKPSCSALRPRFRGCTGQNSYSYSSDSSSTNAEHLVEHALRAQVRCVERILDQSVDVNACCHMGLMGHGIDGDGPLRSLFPPHDFCCQN